MFKAKKTGNFDKAFEDLPPEIQKAARKAFALWLENPFHPSLHFKCIDEKRNIWSVRITLNYRALAYKEKDTFYWEWIGDHREYEKKIKG